MRQTGGGRLEVCFMRVASVLLSVGLITPLVCAQAPAPQAPAAQAPAGTAAGEKAPTPPPLWSVPGAPDFGYMTPGDHASKIMTLMNHGEHPVTVTSVKGDCACTTLEIVGENRVIEPGATLDVLVGFEAPLATGPHTRGIQVFSQEFPDPLLVPIYVDVGFPILVNDDPAAAVIVDRIGIYSIKSLKDKPFTVLAVNGQPPVINYFDPKTDAPRTSYEMVNDFSRMPDAMLPRFVIIETDHPGAEMFYIPTFLPNTRQLRGPTGWGTLEPVLLLGTVDAGATNNVSVTLTGGTLTPGEKLRLIPSHDKLGATITGVRRRDRGPGVVVDIELRTDGRYRGFLAAELNFELQGQRFGVDCFARVVDPGTAPAKGQVAPGH